MARSPSTRRRIVKLTGDGMLAEFPSVVNAVCLRASSFSAECASECRRAADRRIEFRIGVNLGDVIVEGADIYGDGVNVAARLESIARAGRYRRFAIGARSCRQPAAALTFEDRGEQQLKNIEKADSGL